MTNTSWIDKATTNAEFLGKVLLTLTDAERRLLHGDLPDGLAACEVKKVAEFIQEMRSNIACQQAEYLQSITDVSLRVKLDDDFGGN